MKTILGTSKNVLWRVSAWNRKSKLVLLFSIVTVFTFIVYTGLHYELLLSSTKYVSKEESGHKIRGGPCIIPKLNPFNAAVKKFMTPPHHIDCTAKDHPLLFATDLDSNLIVLQDPKDLGYEDCCYTPFTRNGDKDEIYSINCYAIRARKMKVPPPREFVAVYCRRPKSNSYFRDLFNWLFSKRTLVDMLHFVHLKPEVEARLNSFHAQSGNDQNQTRTPNIVILGLDSVSHMNFIRTMPESFVYLTKNLSAIGMNGYSIFEENTFACLVPMFTGLRTEELEPLCWKSKSDYFDDCPFLWKNFSRQGYRTSYAEDSTSMGIFLYEKQGFRDQPTDYYLIPLLSGLDNALEHEGNSTIRVGLCYGPRLGFSILLDNMRKVIQTMGESRKYFQFTWVTSLAHENHNLASAGDRVLKEFLQWMHDENYLANTIFIFMSDHGGRFGPFRQTEQGRLEARMPFLYFVFPDWFSKKYALAVSNVMKNRDRLTTPLDLHETLKDLLDLRQIENEQILKRGAELGNSSASTSTIPRSISLFLQVPDATKRNCRDAGIDLHYCACSPPASLPTNGSKVLEGADSAVKIINRLLAQHTSCAQLSLEYVINAYEIFNSAKQKQLQLDPPVSKSYDTATASNTTNKSASASANESATFVIMLTFKTSPNDAIFEATLVEEKNKWTTSGDISRINKYGTQSHCISDYRLKMYCYCS